MQKRRIEVDIYVADDGMTFSTEAQARYYEQDRADYKIRNSLTKMKLPFHVIGSDNLDGEWILVSNEQVKEYLLRKYTHPNNHRYVNNSPKGHLQLGDWVAILYDVDYSQGEKKQDGLITLSFLLNEMAAFIDKANAITVEGKY